MQALIQRVSFAKVEVDHDIVGEIGRGLLVLLGVEKYDDAKTLNKLLSKVLNYRVFPDEAGKMNLCLKDIAGDLLVVSQFTLAADTRKGLRPSFSSSAAPDLAEQLYDQFVEQASKELPKVATGVFAADMQVSLCNDGPVTFLLSA